jgi:RNA recognition motif-containing protein
MQTTEEELRRTFGSFGPITDVSLKHRENISFAFIEFSEVAEAESALNE